MKTMNVADTLIHVDEDLDSTAREKIEERMRDLVGVIATRFNPGKEHMLSVAFDPEEIHETDLLDNVKKLGYHAELIGL